MIAFSKTHNIKDEAFRQAIDIYLQTIPATERQKVAVIKKRVAAAKEQLLVGKEGNEVVCMALIYPLQGTNFALIDYLAVKKTYKQKGVGTSLIRHIQDTYAAKGWRLIGEVEDPKQGEDRQTRECRLAFYRKNGAKVLKNVPYLMPPMEGNEPTSMILIALTQGEYTEIDGATAKKLIRQIYAELYGRNSTDSLLNSFIDTIPATVNLE